MALGLGLVFAIVGFNRFVPDPPQGPKQPYALVKPRVLEGPPLPPPSPKADAPELVKETATKEATINVEAGPALIGTARICVADDDLSFKELNIPATAVFEDYGALKGKKDDPTTWRDEGESQRAAIETVETVTLTKRAPCAKAHVQMSLDVLRDATSAKADDDRLYRLSDVRDYPIPSKKPDVEIGKLIDDISIKAILLSDVTAKFVATADEPDADTKARICLEGAQKLAASVNAVTGRQTSSIVALVHRSANEASYGCPFGPKRAADVTINWDNRARPTSDTLSLIGKAGAFLTGATAQEVSHAASTCVNEALKPKSNELSDVQFRGVKIECQAFARDGGGGIVTIYRRFGAEPVRAALSDNAKQRMSQASDALKAQQDAEAAKSVEFAKWWLDPAIPSKVKTYAMLSARMIALSERCPSWKLRPERIAELAASAEVSISDIRPGGRYAELVTMMLVSMRAGVAKESVQAACEAAGKYSGE